MNSIITASAPGKIHFLGEHTAVYGKPAILASIDKRCTVTLEPSTGDEIKVTSKNFQKTIRLQVSEILEIRDDAQSKWEKYRETNDIAILKGIVRNEIMYPVVAIGETLRYFNKTEVNGFHLTIDSQIPVGSGHGSSAAVAVSVVGAVTKYLQQEMSFPHRRESSKKRNSLVTGSPIPTSLGYAGRGRLGMINFGEGIDKQTISAIAIRVEQKKHGNPSYGDVGAVVNGGLIWFQKKTPEKIVVQTVDFPVSKKLSDHFLILQSGVPEESTGEMVHYAAEFKKAHPERFSQVLQEQETLTHALLEVLKNGDEETLESIIREGEKNLETIGVVSQPAQKLIRKIEKAGGAAKICGAGGITKGSGIILVYHPDKKVIESLAKKQKLAYYTVQLGGEGLRFI